MLILCHVHAQKVSWQKNIDSNTQDFLSGLAVTIDGQYLVSGSSIQKNQDQTTNNGQPSTNRGYDYHILKLDHQGQKVWERYFSGDRHDYLGSTISSQEGGFLLAGTSYSSLALDKKQRSNGSSDIWIIKIDENGEEEWQQTIGTRYSEEARSVTQTTDHGYVIAGSTNHPKLGYGSKDVLVTRLDKTGKVIGQLILGGKRLDEVEKVIATKDGGTLLGIYSRSGVVNNEELKIKNEDASALLSMTGEEPMAINYQPKTTDNHGEGDYWVVKLDKDMKVQWERNYGGSADDHIRTMALTDTGYIIGGESRSESSGNKRAKLEEGTDLWLLSLDADGNEQWQQSYNFGNRDVLMSLNEIKEQREKNQEGTKGFLIGGYTQAEGKVEKNDETFWMLYVDKNGKEVWRKYVEGKDKKKEERLTSAILNRDGSYILAGTSAEELGKENWKVVKLLDSDVGNLMENKDIQIYPNPVKDYCYVEISVGGGESGSTGGLSADIYVYDMAGKMIQQLQTKNKVTKVDTSRLPQGVYIIKASIPTQKDKKLTTKIVKE